MTRPGFDFGLLTALVLTSQACGGPFVAFAISGRDEPEHCFERDAEAAADVLQTSSVVRFTADDRAALPASFAEVKGPLFAYYAGHGELGAHGETVGASSWNFDRAAPTARLPIGELLEKLKAPWLVILSASCSSAWSDVSRASVPASIISTSRKETYDEPMPASGEPPQACSRPSTLGQLIAFALEGAADSNDDCVITDEELADFVNGATAAWPPERRPDLRVSRNRSAQLPVARVADSTCERNLDRVLEAALAIGGEFGIALRSHVFLARGESVVLPRSAPRYYVTAKDDRALEDAARRRGLVRFPADVATARELAPFAPFTQIVELDLGAGSLRIKDLSTNAESRIPVGSGDLADVLPGCGSVEQVRGRHIYVRFDGAVPPEQVSVRGIRFHAAGAPSPCMYRLSGNCFEITLPSDPVVYSGDPIQCAERVP